MKCQICGTKISLISDAEENRGQHIFTCKKCGAKYLLDWTNGLFGNALIFIIGSTLTIFLKDFVVVALAVGIIFIIFTYKRIFKLTNIT